MRGHLEKRHESSWTIVIELGRDPATGKRKRLLRGFKGNKRAAEAEMVRLLRELETGTFIEPSKLTLAEWLEQWLEMQKSRLSPKTYKRYAEITSLRIKPRLGQILLEKLQPMHLQKFLADIEHDRRNVTKEKRNREEATPKPLSPASIRYHHAVIHRALTSAVRLKLLPRNIADDVELPKLDSEPAKVLTEEQVAAMLEDARATPHYVPVLLAVTTGLRRGEICGLRWQDVDLSVGTVNVCRALSYTPEAGIFFKEPKTARSRRLVTLPPVAVDALKQHKAQQAKQRLRLGVGWTDMDLVFDRGDGQPHHPDTISSWFTAFMRDHGIVDISFHNLRHTHASLLLKQGTNLKVVQERLGHTSITTTMDIYSHLMPGMQEVAAAKIQEVVGNSVVSGTFGHRSGTDGPKTQKAGK